MLSVTQLFGSLRIILSTHSRSTTMPYSRWLCLFLASLSSIIALAGSVIAAPTAVLPQALFAEPTNTETLEDELTAEQEQAMTAEIQHNVALLRKAKMLEAPTPAQQISYGFPLRMAAGFTDPAGFRVSAFADHHPGSGAVLDYTGGTRTYDGHRGTDYALSPFPWNKLNAGEVQVLAAAAGTIVAKSNSDPSDTNCLTSSSDIWNYIALSHADGRMTIYGHVRYNSLTQKAIGQQVTQGEVLATVASSGNSSGPHLHFEMRTGNFTNAEWVDPYAGSQSQPESLWQNQRPYYDSAINKIATHSAPPSTPNQCLPTTTNIQEQFATPNRIYFYLYYRDFQGTLPTQLKIYRPDGSLFATWEYLAANTPFASAWNHGWAYEFASGEQPGRWLFEATYNGQTNSTFFFVDAPATPITYTHTVALPVIHAR
jgi:murein DD-endopeptidase MepM/ murein hydrolase activator NlpD